MGCLLNVLLQKKEDDQHQNNQKFQTSSQDIEKESERDLKKEQPKNTQTDNKFDDSEKNKDDLGAKNNSLDGNVDDCWVKDCQKFNYDLIKNIKEKYVNVLLFKNIQFYYNKINSKMKDSNYQDVNIYEIEGFIYLTEYDIHFNPKYKLQRGIFLINLKERKFQLNGQGEEYQGKSTFIKHIGEFKNGEYISEPKNTINDQNTNQQTKRNNQKIIIITDVTTGIQYNTQKIKRKQQVQVQNFWCKYNQLISNNDLDILKNKRWITSSIIDSYVLKLNLDSEDKYFNLKFQERQKIKRILFLPTSLTTNFGVNFDKKKAIYLLEQELLEYSQMNLEITRIYKKIGFPININNFHWYFLLFDAEVEQVQIFDSTSNFNNFQIKNQNLINTLADVLKINIILKQIHKESGKQINGYSCGYHVCNFMKFCQEQQFNNNQKDYQYDEKHIIQILQKIIAKD
ncbi:unnamed protein product [Paramecium pentaurelia]|uniref:Ubiquitin-like protease family profile domain-containing protein n=1 Tax=Paramecium pentaurelia TaxID=43138 RepID=A0A8S1VQC1_9CILI|nr:unnamed protein product [Paramecium pentaurelia]